MALVCFCVLALARTIAIHGVLPASVTQLERRFNLGIDEIAFIRLAHDVGLVLGLVKFLFSDFQCEYDLFWQFGYNVVRVLAMEKPHWVIGVNGFLIAAGALICSLAYFITDTPSMTRFTRPPRCSITATTSSTSEASIEAIEQCRQWQLFQLLFLVFGFFIIGFGGSGSAVVGRAYLDENTRRRLRRCTRSRKSSDHCLVSRSPR